MQEERRLTAPVVAGLKGAGVFDMALPPALGGPGLDPLQQFEVVESLSIADASVGWCAMIGADSGYYPCFFDDAVAEELYPTRNLVTAGKIAPGGRADRVEDGWRVTGRWDFGSGSTHADRFVGGVFLHDEDGEHLVDDLGLPQWRAAFLPVDEVTVHDTWRTVGMRATASNDYEVVDVFVAEHHLFDPLGPMTWDDPICRLPWWYLCKVGGVLTALARRSIDEAVAAATDKMLMPEFVLLIDRPGTLETVARAEANARSARSFLLDTMHDVWQQCVADGDLSREVTAPMRLAMVHASQVAVDVTRSMFDLLTTSAIRADSIHARLMADAAVANTHVATSHRSWVPLGARLAGRQPTGPTVFI